MLILPFHNILLSFYIIQVLKACIFVFPFYCSKRGMIKYAKVIQNYQRETGVAQCSRVCNVVKI